MAQPEHLSLANLHLGAFHIDGILDLPSSAVPQAGTDGCIVCGYFELVKDVRGSDSACGYKRLQLICTYRIALIDGQLMLLSLNLCPDGTIVRLTAADLTNFRIDSVYTLADVSERARRAIQLNQVTAFVDKAEFSRYLENKKELLQQYAALKAAS